MTSTPRFCIQAYEHTTYEAGQGAPNHMDIVTVRRSIHIMHIVKTRGERHSKNFPRSYHKCNPEICTPLGNPHGDRASRLFHLQSYVHIPSSALSL
jgi:hypothetical protein